jgi:hypothetical protein
MGQATFYIDGVAALIRATEVPNASFANGANNAGSNAPAIGINIGEGAIVGTPEQFTLNNQAGQARSPQHSQAIGGLAHTEVTDWPSSGGNSGAGSQPVEAGTFPTYAEKLADSSLDGTVTVTGNATLTTLAQGWTAGVVPVT